MRVGVWVFGAGAWVRVVEEVKGMIELKEEEKRGLGYIFNNKGPIN